VNGSRTSLALGYCLALTAETAELACGLRLHAVEIITQALDAAGWNATHAARALDVNLRTLNKWRAMYPELSRPSPAQTLRLASERRRVARAKAGDKMLKRPPATSR
jgi:hypothetical protein